MKRYAVIGVVALGLLGAACGGTVSDPGPTTSQQPAVPAPTGPTGSTGAVAPTPDPADVARAALADKDITVKNDAAADKIGGVICGYIDQNGPTQATFLTLVKQVANTFFEGDIQLGAYATGVYIGAYCPEYVDEVNALAGSNA